MIRSSVGRLLSLIGNEGAASRPACNDTVDGQKLESLTYGCATVSERIGQIALDRNPRSKRKFPRGQPCEEPRGDLFDPWRDERVPRDIIDPRRRFKVVSVSHHFSSSSCGIETCYGLRLFIFDHGEDLRP